MSAVATNYATIIPGANGLCGGSTSCTIPLTLNAGDTGVAFGYGHPWVAVDSVTGPEGKSWELIAYAGQDQRGLVSQTIWKLVADNALSGQVEAQSGSQVRGFLVQVFSGVAQSGNYILSLDLSIPGGPGTFITEPIEVTIPGSVVCAAAIMDGSPASVNVFTDSNLSGRVINQYGLGLKYFTAPDAGSYTVSFVYDAGGYPWGYSYMVVVLEPKEEEPEPPTEPEPGLNVKGIGLGMFMLKGVPVNLLRFLKK
jgi:hypothetical protein